ncbi:hypothetical protein J6590_098310, partial [Homalodisca vitripennis]
MGVRKLASDWIASVLCVSTSPSASLDFREPTNKLAKSKGLVDKKIALVYGSREPDWYFPWSRGTVPCWSPACYLSYNKVAPFPSPSNLKEEEVLIVGYPLPLRRAVKDHPLSPLSDTGHLHNSPRGERCNMALPTWGLDYL